MIWIQIVISALSALGGGFIGGWLVAYRMGRGRQAIEDRVSQLEELLSPATLQWRQKVNGRLDTHAARLEKGNPAVDQVPVLVERVNALIEVVGEIKKDWREWLPRMVTQEGCNRRHGDGG